MKRHGTYKLRYHGRRATLPAAPVPEASVGGFLAELERDEHRARRIVDSLRDEILEGGGGPNLRIRCVYRSPREVYRVELSLPDLGYQRITFLDRESLEELLEQDDVREVVETAALGG
ncbi:MAG: hypothetical protein ACQGVC_24735 [Myxococcota bacterium]